MRDCGSPASGWCSDEDVVLNDGGAWKLFFDGIGPRADRRAARDIDAVSVKGGYAVLLDHR